MSDKMITCLDCGAEFNFTAGEQEWFMARQLVEPKYCKDCRNKRRERRAQKENQKHYKNRQETEQKAA